MTKLSDYLHTAAVAEYMGVAQNTLRKWAARGELLMHRNRVNGYRLFKLSDLDKLLKEGGQAGRAEVIFNTLIPFMH